MSIIRTGVQRYCGSVGGREVNIRVEVRNGRDYLTASADGYLPNNLDELPDR